MTPRQLMALADKHRDFEGGATRNGQQMVAQPQRQQSTSGSAGWLMAVANDLNRRKPSPRSE
jgi:hypothetical protein